MKLTGLHVLLTYGCTYECDHCFVWASPTQPGTLTIARLEDVLDQARSCGTIESIYFEGGEPFLHYPLLRWGVRRAADMGFRVGIVTNAYWAVDVDVAREALKDLAGWLESLSVSCDLHHGGADQERLAANARIAAAELGIGVDVIAIAPPESTGAAKPRGQLPPGESALMYRGRAAVKLAARAPQAPASEMTACPYEDLREPGRVHVDPLGFVHVCQGISIGNLFLAPLREICAHYDPDRHTSAGPLLAGGPLELARRHGVDHAGRYADACHLCDQVRRALRPRHPACLAPDQMYGPVATS